MRNTLSAFCGGGLVSYEGEAGRAHEGHHDVMIIWILECHHVGGSNKDGMRALEARSINAQSGWLTCPADATGPGAAAVTAVAVPCCCCPSFLSLALPSVPSWPSAALPLPSSTSSSASSSLCSCGM